MDSSLNSQFYGTEDAKLGDYDRSVQYYFTKEYIHDGDSFLDVGGAGGGLAHAISSEVGAIKATVIDADPATIDKGRASYPKVNFVEGYFPKDLPEGSKFDIISMQGLFPYFPNWKETLLSLQKHTRRYFNISAVLRLDGTTVIDKDVSYVYYLNSGERAHQVVHNIYQFTNFLCLREMGVKRIEFYGYHTEKGGDNFRCVPNSQQIKGNFMIEVFGEDEENPVRMGGAAEKTGDAGYSFFLPEMNIIIDGEKFDVRK